MRTQPEPRTVAALLRESATRLKPTSQSARLDAELLLAHALGWQRVRLYGDPGTVVQPETIERFEELLREREAGRPVAHLVGTREFWSMRLTVTPDTLVPRAETELLVECALKRLPAGEPRRVLELGTGTGAVALALARERPRAAVTAVEFSEAALAVAKYNALVQGLARIEFLFGDWFGPVAGRRFDAVVSNPPYVADQEWLVRQFDLRHEPDLALRGGRDGLAAIRRIVEAAPAHLAADGWLVLEHGFRQGPAVARLFQAAGFTGVTTYRDMPGQPRVTEGRWPGAEPSP